MSRQVIVIAVDHFNNQCTYDSKVLEVCEKSLRKLNNRDIELEMWELLLRLKDNLSDTISIKNMLTISVKTSILDHTFISKHLQPIKQQLNSYQEIAETKDLILKEINCLQHSNTVTKKYIDIAIKHNIQLNNFIEQNIDNLNNRSSDVAPNSSDLPEIIYKIIYNVLYYGLLILLIYSAYTIIYDEVRHFIDRKIYYKKQINDNKLIQNVLNQNV
jgi:hypothetical protein